VARTDPDAAAIADALFGPVPAGRALVAVLDGAVAGLAAYSFLWPAAGVTRSLYLKELFVRAAARRHGIGGLLMRELRAVAAEHRCSRVEWTADTDQPEAQRFYAALGAEVLATKLFYRV
jgi:GNAT superfamily N-acetyltransferase